MSTKVRTTNRKGAGIGGSTWTLSSRHQGLCLHAQNYYRDAESGEDDASDIERMENPETFTTLSDIVDLDGIAIPRLTELDIDTEGFLSGTSINKRKPDGKEYEEFPGYTSESRQVGYRFFRTAMILVHESKLGDASLRPSVA